MSNSQAARRGLSVATERPQEGGDELFNAKHQITSTHTSELVIALCGPIGSPLHRIAEAIKARLETDFKYDRCTLLRLSETIERHTSPTPSSTRYERIASLIAKGDYLRKQHGSSVLAELAVSQIVLDRQKAKGAVGVERFISRRVCHIINSIKNQSELDILKLVYGDMFYFVGVYSPLPARVKALQKDGMSVPEIYKLGRVVN